MAKLSKKDNRKDKKKRFLNQKQKYTEEQKKQILATNINITNILKKKKSCDINKITCFNYNKKIHFANDCIKLKN